MSHVTLKLSENTKKFRTENNICSNSAAYASLCLDLESLKEIARDVSWLTEEAERFKDTLAKLEKQQLIAQKYRERLTKLISPICKIPVELLTEIFRVYCEDEVLDESPIFKHPADVLSAVCSQWKNIVENSPGIWSCISVTIGRTRDSEPAARRVLGRCLGMSKQSPLDVVCSKGWHNRTSVSLLKMALEHSERWQSADIEFDSSDVTALIAQFLERSPGQSHGTLFPMLRTLKIISPFWGVYIPFYRAPLPFQPSYLPRLREFSLSCRGASMESEESLETSLSLYKLSLDSGLTSLEICEKLHDEELVFLKEFPCLKQVLLLQYAGRRSPGSTMIYTSSSVTHLAIRIFMNQMNEATLTLFSHLNLPSLNSLKVSQCGTSPNTAWNSSSFKSMAQRSACALQSIYLDEIQIHLGDLVHLLQLVPTLHDLTFHEYSPGRDKSGVGSQIIRALAWSSSSTTSLLPRLTDIELKAYSFLNDELLNLISNMIASRISVNDSSNRERRNLTFFRFYALSGASETLYHDPDLLMRSLEMQAKGHTGSGPSFHLTVYEESEPDEDSVWSDDTSVFITEDSDYDRREWEEDFPSDASDIVAEEEGESDIITFDPNVSAAGERLIEQYYRAL